MRRTYLDCFLLLIFCVCAQYSFAQAAPTINMDPTTASDIINSLVALIKNWKGMGALAMVSGIVALLVQIAKATFLSSVWDKWGPLKQHAVVVTLAWASQILISISSGINWLDSLVAGLATGGGAIAIYEAISGALKAPKV